MKNLFNNRLEIKCYLLSIIIFFLSLALPLLTKDPVVFPDEVSFSNTAYSITNKEAFSISPFSGRLPVIEKTDLIHHGPIYYWLLSFSLKIFGFSIIASRLTSIFIGILTLLVSFFLIKVSLKNVKFGLLISLLLAIDYNFLRSARMARPEISVCFFNYLTLFFYLKTLKHSSWKNYLLIGLFAALGFFTHFLLGLIAPLTIFFHLLVSKNHSFFRNKNVLYLILTPVLCFSMWLFYLYPFPPALFKSIMAVSNRIFPDFYSIKSIFRGDFYIKILFCIYFLSSLLLLFSSKKSSLKTFWLLNYLVTFMIVAFGGLDWYLGLLALPAYSALIFVGKEWEKRQKTNLNYLWFALISILIMINLIEQIRLNSYYDKFSYNDFSQKISSHLTENSKIFLRQMIPESYFFLAQHRKDLKLAYEQFYDYDQSNFKTSLSKADYVVTYGIDYEVLSFWEKLESSDDPNKAIKYNAVIKKYNINPVLIDYLKNHQEKVSLIEETKYHSSIAIFRLRKVSTIEN